MRSTLSRMSGALLACALLATGCGARLAPEQEAAAQRLYGSKVVGNADRPAPATTSTRPGASATPVPPEGQVRPEPAESTGGIGPEGGTPDGPASSAASSDGGAPEARVEAEGPPADCASASAGLQEPGVTDTTIELGNVSLLSGPIPGFANTAVGGIKAFLNYQNSQGGVCGRQLKLAVSDDRFDAGTNRSEHERLAGQVLGFVGSLSVVDDGGVSVLRDTTIPDVSLALSDAKLALANSYSPTPINVAERTLGATEFVRFLMEREGITEYALVWPAQATARNRAEDYRNDFQAAGLTSAYESEVAVTETNYTPASSAICNAQPDRMLLTTVLEVNGMARLVKALRQQGCMPRVANVGTQAYGEQFLQLAGAAANGVRIALQNDIVEDPSSPLTATFSEWYARTNPGLAVDFFAIQAWAAGHMLVTALQNAGPELTRQRVLAELNALTDYDADGMIAPITPSSKRGSNCYLMVRVAEQRWTRDFPAEGFTCV